MPNAGSTRKTRAVAAGPVVIGGGYPVVLQSMCTVPTTDVRGVVRQAESLLEAGAGLVRVAVDSPADVLALAAIRRSTRAALVVDLQENWRLAREVAPHVAKIRYNPGHLHHHERARPVREKVSEIARICADHGLALRVGVNAGSLGPCRGAPPVDPALAMVETAVEHSDFLEDAGFEAFVVSLKDSDPRRVVAANEEFAERRPHVPIHLGVTEAGLPPEGILRTRLAFEPLLARRIGETVRVSLTLPPDRKADEVRAARHILADIEAGRFVNAPDLGRGLHIVSCPSCGRVESSRFVELAERVRERARRAREHDLVIAVMGCRVNGPGETDHANLGLWCGPNQVHLKRGRTLVGVFGYDEILDAFDRELSAMLRTVTAKRRSRYEA